MKNHSSRLAFACVLSIMGAIRSLASEKEGELFEVNTPRDEIRFDDFDPLWVRYAKVDAILSAPEWEADGKHFCGLVEVMPDEKRAYALAEKAKGGLSEEDRKEIEPIPTETPGVFTTSGQGSSVGSLLSCAGILKPLKQLAGPNMRSESLSYGWAFITNPYRSHPPNFPKPTEYENPRARVKLNDEVFSSHVQPDQIQVPNYAIAVLDPSQKPTEGDDPRIVSATPMPKEWFPWVEEAFKRRDTLKKMQPEDLVKVTLDPKQGTFVRLLAARNLKGQSQSCAQVIKGLLASADQQPDMALEFLLAQAAISMGGEKLPEMTTVCDAFTAKEIKDHPHGSHALNAYVIAMRSAADYGLCRAPIQGGRIWYHSEFLDIKRSRWCSGRLDRTFRKLGELSDHRFTLEGKWLYLYAKMGGFKEEFQEHPVMSDDVDYAKAYHWWADYHNEIKEREKREAEEKRRLEEREEADRKANEEIERAIAAQQRLIKELKEKEERQKKEAEKSPRP